MSQSEQEKVILISTSCLGCAIQLVAFKDEDRRGDSCYITTLSNHIYEWRTSWRGRLHFAWMVLRGKWPGEIELNTAEDVEKFKRGFDEIYEWLKKEK